MPEKTREKESEENCGEEEKTAAETIENTEKGIWEEDQKEKSYYYDDSHGYEIYNPDDDDNE